MRYFDSSTGEMRVKRRYVWAFWAFWAGLIAGLALSTSLHPG